MTKIAGGVLLAVLILGLLSVAVQILPAVWLTYAPVRTGATIVGAVLLVGFLLSPLLVRLRAKINPE